MRSDKHVMGAVIMIAAPLALSATPVLAKVEAAESGGFVVTSSVETGASPALAYEMLISPDRWWIAAHSYSGDARNFRLDARAGGCFCETLPTGGGVEHGRVIFAQPGKILRINGALGPLQQDAVTGTLSFTLEPSGQGTRIVMRYAVGGYRPGGLAALAPVVDRVMGEQLASLGKAVDTAAK